MPSGNYQDVPALKGISSVSKRGDCFGTTCLAMTATALPPYRLLSLDDHAGGHEGMWLAVVCKVSHGIERLSEGGPGREQRR